MIKSDFLSSVLRNLYSKLQNSYVNFMRKNLLNLSCASSISSISNTIIGTELDSDIVGRCFSVATHFTISIRSNSAGTYCKPVLCKQTFLRQTKTFLSLQDQYEFCYRAALEYLGSFDHYAN